MPLVNLEGQKTPYLCCTSMYPPFNKAASPGCQQINNIAPLHTTHTSSLGISAAVSHTLAGFFFFWMDEWICYQNKYCRILRCYKLPWGNSHQHCSGFLHKKLIEYDLILIHWFMHKYGDFICTSVLII